MAPFPGPGGQKQISTTGGDQPMQLPAPSKRLLRLYLGHVADGGCAFGNDYGAINYDGFACRKLYALFGLRRCR